MYHQHGPGRDFSISSGDVPDLCWYIPWENSQLRPVPVLSALLHVPLKPCDCLPHREVVADQAEKLIVPSLINVVCSESISQGCSVHVPYSRWVQRRGSAKFEVVVLVVDTRHTEASTESK